MRWPSGGSVRSLRMMRITEAEGEGLAWTGADIMHLPWGELATLRQQALLIRP